MSSVYAKRFEAVFLCANPKGPLMSYTAAAKYVKKLKSSVKKWVERYKASKTVDDLPERGKSRATTSKQDKAIIKTENAAFITILFGCRWLMKLNFYFNPL